LRNGKSGPDVAWMRCDCCNFAILSTAYLTVNSDRGAADVPGSLSSCKVERGRGGVGERFETLPLGRDGITPERSRFDLFVEVDILALSGPSGFRLPAASCPSLYLPILLLLMLPSGRYSDVGILSWATSGASNIRRADSSANRFGGATRRPISRHYLVSGHIPFPEII
jgi:hypothetical protein